MQTFVPHTDHRRTAQVLDRQRLFTQLVDTKKILAALDEVRAEPSGPVAGVRHPVVLMWQGHESALSAYGAAIMDECTARGLFFTPSNFGMMRHSWDAALPDWWGGPIHWTHQANLCHMDWDRYGPLFPRVDITDAFPPEGNHRPAYFWPKPQATVPQRDPIYRKSDLGAFIEQKITGTFLDRHLVKPVKTLASGRWEA